jgi:hypothetical protein
MRLEHFNLVPFEHDVDRFAPHAEALPAEPPAEAAAAPDEAPSGLLQQMARHPPAHAFTRLPYALRGRLQRDDPLERDDAWRPLPRERQEPQQGFEFESGGQGELHHQPPPTLPDLQA